MQDTKKMGDDKNIKTVDDYLLQLAPKAKQKLSELRSFIKAQCPQETTEKISWEMPTLFLNGNLIQYAAFKDHYSVFPGPDVLDVYNDELSNHRSGKGTLRFDYDKPLNSELLTKIIAYRVEENLNKKSKKRKSQ